VAAEKGTPGEDEAGSSNAIGVEPMENFEPWLLHRVAQPVEAGEVSADLLAALLAEIEAALRDCGGPQASHGLRTLVRL
jgi:hypothetical protein